ncbi:MAG: cytochrome c [Candidatus Eremiobacteraeota bacterium]|nr:cytochrome c [Candidatus Eremiobacteraeota bacterium]
MSTATWRVFLAVALVAFGCAACGTETPQNVAASGKVVGNPERGKTTFAANCAVCHGATGTEGGVGPSLRHERRRMDIANTTSWIEDPEPPMPKLYPTVLSEQDVQDVAAYVDSL